MSVSFTGRVTAISFWQYSLVFCKNFLNEWGLVAVGVGFSIAQLALRSRPAPDITGEVHQDLPFTLLAVHLKSGQVPFNLDFFFTPYIHSFVIDSRVQISITKY